MYINILNGQKNFRILTLTFGEPAYFYRRSLHPALARNFFFYSLLATWRALNFIGSFP